MKNLARIFLIAFILASFSSVFAAQQSHKSPAAQQNHKYKISSQNLRAKDHSSKNIAARSSAEPHAKKPANAKSLSNSKLATAIVQLVLALWGMQLHLIRAPRNIRLVKMPARPIFPHLLALAVR